MTISRSIITGRLLPAAGLIGLLFMTLSPVYAEETVPTSGPVTAVVRNNPFPELMEGPARPEERAEWLQAMRRFREEQREILRKVYQEIPEPYAEPSLQWAPTNFVHAQMMAHDRYFYDPATRRYTVDRYLDDLIARYGGIDSVLIWPTYPNIGVDNRNQFDLFRDMPGGLPAVRQMIADFKRRGVRTFWPIMIWDTGSRDEGVSMPQSHAEHAKATGIDGLNGDTMRGVTRDFYQAALDVKYPLAMEPELNVEQPEGLAWNTMSWGYWWPYGPVPGVNRYKWIEPRHMTHVTDRWAHDRNDMLQYAFFNGSGYNAWENVWSIWMMMTPRNGEALRRISSTYRAVPELIVSPDYEPFYPVEQPGVYATQFPGAEARLWTIINRTGKAISGPVLTADAPAGTRFFDLWNGLELTPAVADGKAQVSIDMEPHGYGAVLATKGPPPAKVEALLAERKKAATKLADFSNDWKPLTQRMLETSATAPAKEPPAGMVRVPGGPFVFEAHGVMIERHEPGGTGVQFPWETTPQIMRRHKMTVKPFHIDRCPVTCAEFQKFVEATQYKPADDHNFLRGWTNGRHPAGWEKKPVTWVSLEDARAYATWAGKRLPHDWEWQLAAQGTDGRRFPWGNDDETSHTPHYTPPFLDSREQRLPTDVDAFPHAASPYGVLDLVGNVWQWTDEFHDDHTRCALVRGGSYYRPKESHWYFPQARDLKQHGKYLLMAPSLDRSGTIGFRCVKDAE